jgi:trans-2,3-dihydro-3-hydroxyanthranilate isomerase
MQFFIVDVFAESKYSGNQLAVFLGDSSVTGDEMQKIAREMHFSESTFILLDKKLADGFAVRIFTPAQEVDFAGHPTLGTAYIIREKILQQPLGRVTLQLKVGPIPVHFPAGAAEPLWMDQIQPIFGANLEAPRMAEVLNLPLAALDANYPIQEVSTGLPHIIVPLRSLEFLKKAKVDRARYFQFIEKTWAKNILVFSREPYAPDQDVSVRMFADYLGVPEDPATGSGGGCLSGYMVKHRYCGSPYISIRAGQGYEIGRPSLLYLRAEERDGSIHIAVGGKVAEIAEGQWR